MSIKLYDTNAARQLPDFADPPAQPACQGQDPELWYPTTHTANAEIAKAKDICHHCPLTEQCRDWAIDTGQGFGIWGGTTATERRRIAHHRATHGRP